MNRQNEIISQMTDKQLLLNLYFTQGILLILAIIGSYFVFPSWSEFLILFEMNAVEIFIYGGSIAISIVMIDLFLYRIVPKRFIDDGGINERIFSRRKVWEIFILCAVIAFVEELLFRGVIQTAFGYFIASTFFAVIHVRYLKKMVLFIAVVAVSFVLGWLFLFTNNILATMYAHFLIDFLLGLFIMAKYRKQ